MYEICAREVREGNGGRAFPRISQQKIGAAAMARVSANLAADGRSGDGALFRESCGRGQNGGARPHVGGNGARFCESRGGWRSGGASACRRQWRARANLAAKGSATAMTRVSAKLAAEGWSGDDGARPHVGGNGGRARISQRMGRAAAMARVSANLAAEDRTAARVRMLRAGHAGTHKPASRILSPFIPRKRPAREPQPLLSDFDQTRSASRRTRT